jgi:CTP-dependent riboflavin kinase
MRIFVGIVVKGFSIASGNLAPNMERIASLMGLTELVPGTLNVEISEDYVVQADAKIFPHEYIPNRGSHLQETIKLQRCLIAGRKAIITRPDTHEICGWGHGTRCLEIMGREKFRQALSLCDGSQVDIQVEGNDRWWGSGI